MYIQYKFICIFYPPANLCGEMSNSTFKKIYEFDSAVSLHKFSRLRPFQTNSMYFSQSLKITDMLGFHACFIPIRNVHICVCSVNFAAKCAANAGLFKLAEKKRLVHCANYVTVVFHF